MKTFNIQLNIGMAKYLVNYHNGIDTHKDGSPRFAGIICKSKKELTRITKGLTLNGYVEQ